MRGNDDSSSDSESEDDEEMWAYTHIMTKPET